MGTAAATADRPSQPDPTPDRSPAERCIPDGIARLLGLLRWIVGYGQACAATLRHNPAGPRSPRFVRTFRTADIAAILARIQRGLLIAAGLQAHLLQHAAAGRPLREIEPRFRHPPLSRLGPRQVPAQRHTNLIALPLHLMPTEAQIAAELHRRPIGAVLVDICRDLGLDSGEMPLQQWQALRDAVLAYGGKLVNLLFREWRAPPQLLASPGEPQQPAAPVPPAAPHVLVRPCPTGPPG